MMVEKVQCMPVQYKYNDRYCIKNISNFMINILQNSNFNNILILCIGTDKYTWDSLGPLVGTILSKKRSLKNKIEVLGTLTEPVNAMNIKDIADNISKDKFVIAVDAAFGNQYSSKGMIITSRSPLKPGSAFHGDLPMVGNIAINGIISSISEIGTSKNKKLENIRLGFVYAVAEKISTIIQNSVKMIN